MKQGRSKTFRGYNEFGFFNEFLKTGQALAQRSGLPFADGDLSGRSVGHDKQKAALEVRLDLFDPRHIDQHLAYICRSWIWCEYSVSLHRLRFPKQLPGFAQRRSQKGARTGQMPLG